MTHESVGPIGPSTGWLSAKLGNNLDAHHRVLEGSRAGAAEMVCHNDERMRSMLVGRLPQQLDYVSLHLPNLSCFAPEENASPESRAKLEKFIAGIRVLLLKHSIRAAPTHPEVTPEHLYAEFNNHNIPVCIENMDRQKGTGKYPEEIRVLGTRHRIPYILDVQHAYEVAKDMGQDATDFSGRFADVMCARNQLCHLHVSGEIFRQGKQLNNHALVHQSTNRNDILASIRTVLARAQKPVPIILEGETLPGVPEGYVPHDYAETLELEARCIGEIRKEMECVMEGLASSR